MAIIEGGSSSAGKANVGVTNVGTYALSVQLPTDETVAGFATLASELDDGTVTGSRYIKGLEASKDFRLRVGVDTPQFQLSFEGTNIARDRIQQNDTTMTCAQTNGAFTLNSGASVTTGQATNIRTYRHFPVFVSAQTWIEWEMAITNATATNVISEEGLGYCSTTTTQMTDGIVFRRTSGGSLFAVVVNNSTDIVTQALTTTNVPSRDGTGSFDASETNHYMIAFHLDEVQWWINDVLVYKCYVPAAYGSPTSSTSLPFMARVNNTGAASAARQVVLRLIAANQGEFAINRSWSHTLCGMGSGSYQTQPGTAAAQTANYANSAAPASATLSNTAASYTTLGGQYQFAANATNETDWALFGYQNPAGTATLAGRTFYVTSIRIGEMHVTGAALVNPTMFYWAAAAGSTAVSLATTDAAATLGPRRVALGGQSFLATAAIGTQSTGFTVAFGDAPLVVHPGCFLHIILKQLNGAATASVVFRGTVTVVGYFE